MVIKNLSGVTGRGRLLALPCLPSSHHHPSCQGGSSALPRQCSQSVTQSVTVLGLRPSASVRLQLSAPVSMAEREPRRRQGRKEKEGQRPHQRSSATGLFFAVAAEESESEAGSVKRRGPRGPG